MYVHQTEARNENLLQLKEKKRAKENSWKENCEKKKNKK